MIGDLLRRYWATAFLVACVLIAGLVTGALWREVADGSPLFDDVAYGLPALQEGRWWTFLTGMFFAPALILYVPILLLLVLVASTYERRVGHVRTIVVAIGGQFLAGLLTALFLWIFHESGWTWARELGDELDLGISAGGFALMGALSAVMQPIWRNRVRVGVGAYLFAVMLNSGLLWDIEHWIAFVLGVFAGPFLAGRAPVMPQVRFTRRTQRALVALIVAVFAIASLVEGVFPGNGGPFQGPSTVVEQSTETSLALIIGAVIQLAAADGLRRGRRLAWTLIVVVLALSLFALFSDDASAERTADFVLNGGLLLLMLVTFQAFTARSGRKSFRHAGRRLFWVAFGLLVYTAVGFFVLQDEFVPTAKPIDMLSEFFSRLVFTTSGNIEPVSSTAEWFVNSIGVVWLTAILITLVGLIYSSRRARPFPEAEPRLRSLLHQHHSSNIGWMLTWRDITAWFTADGETTIGYKVVGSVALCLADPVGPLEKREAALREFDEYCFRRGWIPCLFAAGQQTADLASGLNWTAVEIAEDSVMRLEQLEFKGKAFQDVRTAINKAGKQNVELVVTSWADSKPVVTDQLRAISGGWVSDKALPEMGFTLGTLPRGRGSRGPPAPRRRRRSDRRRLHLVDAGVRGGAGRRLDARPDAPPRSRLPSRDGVHDRCLGDAVEGGGLPVRQPLRGSARQGARRARGEQRPAGAAEAPRLPRQDAGAVLRLPVAVRLQAEVPSRAPSDVPRVPGHDGTRRDRHRRCPCLHARRRAVGLDEDDVGHDRPAPPAETGAGS